jgi:hypothetical protein
VCEFKKFLSFNQWNPYYFFRSTRGLIHSCPLSPLLFLLIVEGLSRLLKKLVDDEKIRVAVAKGIRITHQLFVDDIILFGRGSLIEWGLIKEALDLFSNASGMTYSALKSQFLEVGSSS